MCDEMNSSRRPDKYGGVMVKFLASVQNTKDAIISRGAESV